MVKAIVKSAKRRREERQAKATGIDLLAEAKAAHDAGETWESFEQRTGGHIAAAEPFDAQRWRRLHTRLWMLVHHGDGNTQADDPEPWRTDDRADARANMPAQLGLFDAVSVEVPVQ